MKIKTSELTGAALDWAVATAAQYEIRINSSHGLFANDGDGFEYFTPDMDWSQGGPIIERERIELSFDGAEGGVWAASFPPGERYGNIDIGPTPLIAAMRCFVASKLGDEVDVPEELL